MKKNVAIQGIQGSYHHQVAEAYFGKDIVLNPCLSFDALVKSVIDGASDVGVMAIENSIAGSIIPNYALIDRYDLCITGEHYLNIHHQLMALKGTKFDEITEVASHPMALLQCRDFLLSHPNIRLVEDKDTAEVAQRISQHQIKGLAAVASSHAAKLFGLEILASDIQTISNNSTRFVIVEKKSNRANTDINKASVKFMLDHKRGSLATTLNVLSDCQLNLTKIQSLPVIETPWKYAFFVDVTFEKPEYYHKASSILEIMTASFKELGTYKNNKL